MNISHATFAELSDAGYDIRTFEHSIERPYFFEELDLHDIPDAWKFPQPVIVPKAAMLRDAILFYDGATLLPSGHYCLSDYHFWEKDRWLDFSAKRYIDTDNNGLILPNIRKISIPGRCFPILGLGSRNFGHFIHDFLTRIYYEDLGVIAPGREKVIAPNFHNPMQQILFSKIFAGYEIVYIPRKSAVKTEFLVLSANLCSGFEFNPAGIHALSERMKKIMAPYAGAEKHKICVSRRDGKIDENLGRNFSNYDEFEKKMRFHGYQIVEVSKIDPDTQFSLWANTRDIVGIHGAGMMNMIMMPRKSAYTEISSAVAYQRTWTVRCAIAAGHQVRGIISQKSAGSPKIDLKKLEEIISCGGLSNAKAEAT